MTVQIYVDSLDVLDYLSKWLNDPNRKYDSYLDENISIHKHPFYRITINASRDEVFLIKDLLKSKRIEKSA